MRVGPALRDSSRSEKPIVVAATDKEAAASGLFGPAAKRPRAEGERREEAGEASARDSDSAAVAAGEEQV